MRFVSRWRLAGAALLASVLAAAPLAESRAADVSDDAASELERQVHDWLASLLGRAAPLSERPVRFEARDDHFAAEIQIDGAIGGTGATVESEPMTARVRPLDDGRWAIEDIRTPSPLRMTVSGPGGTMTTTLTIDEQEQHATLDPALATASILDTTLPRGYSVSSEGPTGTSRTGVERYVSHIVWQPSGGGRMDLRQESDGDLFTMNAVDRQTGAFSISAERMRAVAHLSGMNPDQIGPLLRAAFTLEPAMAAAAQAAANAQKDGGTKPDGQKAGGKKPASGTAKTQAAKAAGTNFKMTPAMRASLHTAVLALQDVATGMDYQGTAENMHVQAAGFSGHVSRLAAGMGLSAPAGRLAFHMNFALDGMESPDLPPGPIRDFLPRHIAFSPRVSGLPSADVMALLLHAVDSDGNDPALQQEAEALIGKGPIAVGLDEVALDVGPATLKGGGELQIADRDTYSGTAHLAATGLDALIKRANTTPELKQAAPVLIFLKGVGQQTGDTVVWDIDYHDGKMLVNGNDMSQMMPGK